LAVGIDKLDGDAGPWARCHGIELKAFPGVSRVTSLKAEEESEM
jgi:hypothetical protein